MSPELTFDKLAFRVYRGAALVAEGRADRASLRRDTSDFLANGIAVRFAESAGRPPARVTATQLQGNLKDRKYVASAGVTAEQQGQVAVTDRARYDGADGLVRGDRPIEVRGPGFRASGASFTLDPRGESVRLLGGTRVVATGGTR